MMFGIRRLPAYIMFWSSDPLLHVPAVAGVMSRNRYQAISRYFHIAKTLLPVFRGTNVLSASSQKTRRPHMKELKRWHHPETDSSFNPFFQQQYGRGCLK
ncbi:hypothetical protein RRG08_022807 [Elysia crispata]|uniref:PiggyBac transposable element-derived protein domain-containing protein n=1 Tax=Elysia crispata TaxID=231223 RepID=A0AAE0Z0J6_9GAST|nr:hypothetical protein RRG08_022807 [Elysia crispata]